MHLNDGPLKSKLRFPKHRSTVGLVYAEQFLLNVVRQMVPAKVMLIVSQTVVVLVKIHDMKGNYILKGVGTSVSLHEIIETIRPSR